MVGNTATRVAIPSREDSIDNRCKLLISAIEKKAGYIEQQPEVNNKSWGAVVDGVSYLVSYAIALGSGSY